MKRIVGEKIDGKAKSENDKGSLGARLIHYPVVRGISFFFFLYQTLGFLNGKEADKKAGGRFSLLGHGVCGRSGQRHF